MAISERVDLVGNVSQQARAWSRDLARLAAQARKLNQAMGGRGGGGSMPGVPKQARARGGSSSAEVREQRAKADALREQARAAAAAGRAQAKAARDQARAETTAAKQRSRAEAAAAKAQQKAAATSARAAGAKVPTGARAPSGGGQGKAGNKALPRQEVGGIGGALNSMAGNLMADAATAAMSALAGMMKSMASTFIEAQKFRENSLAGLTILHKSGIEANKTWKESFKLARETGTTQQETMSSIQGLMSKGFKKNDAVELYKLMNAVSVVNPAANLDGIVTAIGQIKNTGKLQGDELLQLADAGVSVDAVYKALGKRLGKTREQIIAMQGAGDIKADDAIAAIKDAMKESVGGDVNGALHTKANSLSAIMGQLQAAPMTFFSGLEQDPALMEKMKVSLKSLVDMMDPSTAKGKQTAESFSKLIDVIAGPGADLFTKMVAGAPEFLATLTSLGESLGPIISLLGALGGASLYVQSGIAKFIEMIRSAGSVGSIWSWIPALIAQIAGLGSTFSSGGASMGSQLISGIVQGIFGGSSSVVSAIMSMAQTAIGAGNSAFQIRSPSRVFADMGEQLPAGLSRGVVDNMAVVERSSQAMAGSATNATSSALPFIGDAFQERGMGRQTTNNFGGIRFNAGGFNVGGPGQAQPEDIARDINRLIQQGVQNFMNKSAEAA